MWSTPKTQMFTSSWEGSVTLSPRRELVVFGSDKKTIRIWNEETGENDNESMKGHIDPISSLSFSSDGRYLASGSEDKNVIAWDFCPFRSESGMSSSQAHGTEPIVFAMHLREMSCIKRGLLDECMGMEYRLFTIPSKEVDVLTV
ncbi:WD40 domain containing protein [Pyrrhoderma noxium]|uniref:WD40 domain containing protein n=1 Tax=Pyrrhoderma noxium TaxID=2282107 RepID=A0A286U8D4_9AGAM|nr:WD40 domain containing protein [Pyrrhoderma noxium]